MRARTPIVLAAASLYATAAAAGPPVTSPDVPSPAGAVAARWAVAAFQAPLYDYLDPRVPRPDTVKMLSAVLRDEKLGPGVGWYGPSQRRHDWAWLAARYDANRDGRVTRAEAAGASAYFDALDRDHSGAVTAEDFDWSEKSPWVRQDAQALRLFRAIDADGNGRATDAELADYFARATRGKGHLTADEFRDLIAGGGGKGKEGKGKKVDRDTWLRCLMAGDLGSPFDGPAVGQEAPDFTLASDDGRRVVTLSEVWGKKPVVLVFGSFT
jgi:hypothetical protein